MEDRRGVASLVIRESKRYDVTYRYQSLVSTMCCSAMGCCHALTALAVTLHRVVPTAQKLKPIGDEQRHRAAFIQIQRNSDGERQHPLVLWHP